MRPLQVVQHHKSTSHTHSYCHSDVLSFTHPHRHLYPNSHIYGHTYRFSLENSYPYLYPYARSERMLAVQFSIGTGSGHERDCLSSTRRLGTRIGRRQGRTHRN